MQKALFAAGCFWGVQDYFDQVPGVVATAVGYTGGTVQNPTYEQVCTEKTGHAEALLIEFDQAQVTYADLLSQFFRMHDATQLNRQGPDVGTSYRSAIFYFDDQQKAAAEAAKRKAGETLGKPIATEIAEASEFWPAEDYHQKFVQKNGYGACHVPFAPLDSQPT